MNPVHDPNDPPVPWVIDRSIAAASPRVDAAPVPYSFTVEARLPEDVTAMHLVPVDPGLRLLAVNAAVLVSSSASATVPLAQLLVGLTVVAEYAE